MGGCIFGLVVFLLVHPSFAINQGLLFRPTSNLIVQLDVSLLPWSGSLTVTKSAFWDDAFLFNPLNLLLYGSTSIDCAFKLNEIIGDEVLFEWTLSRFLLTCSLSPVNQTTEKQMIAQPIPNEMKKFDVYFGDFGGAEVCVENLRGIKHKCQENGEAIFPTSIDAVNVECGCASSIPSPIPSPPLFLNTSTSSSNISTEASGESLLNGVLSGQSNNVDSIVNSSFADSSEQRQRIKLRQQEVNNVGGPVFGGTSNDTTTSAPLTNSTPVSSITTSTTTPLTTTAVILINSSTNSTTSTTTSATTTYSTTTTPLPTTTSTTTLPPTTTSTTTTPIPLTTTPDPCAVYCMNNGTCMISGGVPVCHCAQYYNGSRCENHNLCVGNTQCLNNATCFGDSTTFSCTCVKGYIGKFCKEIDSCARWSPCLEGICSNIPKNGNNYSCDCPSDYFGVNCGQKNVCKFANPCQNGGNCVVNTTLLSPPLPIVTNATFTCTCPPKFSGSQCEVVASPLGGGLSGGEIAAIVLCILLTAVLAVASYFLVKWVRNSRRLKGKYNPAKEENVASNGPSVAMSDLNAKEERLI